MEKEEQINAKKFREGNISIVLDSYDDLFSDFDPRPYRIRALSDDFLLECKKATVDKKKKIELRLLVPKKKRIYDDEAKIKKRLRRYFQEHFREKESEIKKIKRSGFFWFFCGAVLMSMEAFLMGHEKFFLRFLATVLIPAGWFFFWEGLGKIFIESKEKMPDFDFHKKMLNAEIYFENY